MIETKQIAHTRQHIVYDAARLTKFEPRLFDPAYLQQQDLITGQALGRGTTLFFSYLGQQMVLRHYRRGGLVARALGDRYLWTGLNHSRAWREWRLLADLTAMGLPAPIPVAARVRTSGLLARADLITIRVPNAVTLSARLGQQALGPPLWQAVGSMIRRFHDAGVEHADLNAHNILLQEASAYLIDFDRGRIRSSGTRWKTRNLQRLLRSLRKLQCSQPTFHFVMSDWQALLSAYGGES